MSNTVVLLGPSLALQKAKAILPNATYFPPVQCGDIFRLLEKPPLKIVIIDGNFHQCAAVWHKEILYAMERGITVYGASSMGALRAAELSAFGMQGIGTIFEWYRDGIIDGDDEVALLHSDANSKIQFSTEPLINWRVTLQTAQLQQVISRQQEQELLQAIGDIYYQERSYESIIDLLKEKGEQSFLDWLKQDNYINQKELDALAALNHVKNEAISVANVTTEKTVALLRLSGYVGCEADRAIKNIDNLRVKRLLAYSLKTADRIDAIVCDPIDKQISLFREKKFSVNHQPHIHASVYTVANHLSVLQRQSPEDRTMFYWVNVFVALVITKILTIFDSKKITVAPSKLDSIKAELSFLKQENLDDALIITYTILKDFVNNDFDLFLVGAQLPVIGKDYFQEAGELFTIFSKSDMAIQT